MDQSVYYYDVRNCSSCGRAHERLPFQRLEQPRVDGFGRSWEFRGLCPTSAQPLYLRYSGGSPSPVLCVFLSDAPMAQSSGTLEELARRVAELERQMKAMLNILTGGK